MKLRRAGGKTVPGLEWTVRGLEFSQAPLFKLEVLDAIREGLQSARRGRPSRRENRVPW